MDYKTRIKNLYRGFNVAEKLIFINIVIFFIVSLINAIYFSFTGIHLQFFFEYFTLPNGWELLYKPWTLVTYAFMHIDFMHLIFNCLILYYTGRIFYTYFTEKQFITVYVYGIFSGAILFLIAYNLLPAFAGDEAILMGASAAVLAILVAGATYAPDLIINLFRVLPIKYWILAVLLIISYVSSISFNDNAGGNFAHIGGALIGFLYIKQLTKGNDIGIRFEKFWDSLTRYFTRKKKSPLKTVYNNKSTSRSTKTTTSTSSSNEKQRKVDAILDKISKSGYESLTKQEKDFLFKAGKEN